MSRSLAVSYTSGVNVRVWLYNDVLDGVVGFADPIETTETNLGWYTLTFGVFAPSPDWYWVVFYDKGTGTAFSTQYVYWTGEEFLDSPTYAARRANASAQAAEEAAQAATRAARLAGQLTQV